MSHTGNTPHSFVQEDFKMSEAPPAPKKRRVLRYVVIALLVVVAGLAALVTSQPDTFRVARTASLKAPPSAVFPLINNLREWKEWSPYEKLDPDMKKTFEGAELGVGSSYTWSGNSQAGEGTMTITESQPDQLVVIKLEFRKPFAAVCRAKFEIEPEGAGSKVTWSMEGANDFMGKAIHLVMDMDGMVGKDFEDGLKDLDVAALKRATPPPQNPEPTP